MADLKDFAEKLVNLTVKEVSELADILKDEYGIEPAAAAVVAAGGGGAAGGAQGRQLRAGGANHHEPHQLAGRAGRAVPGPVPAPGCGAGARPGWFAGDPEVFACARRPARPAHRLGQLLGGRGLAGGRPGAGPWFGHAGLASASAAAPSAA